MPRINALEEADQHLERGADRGRLRSAELERIEERLFALRAAARKYSTPVDGLAALAAKYAADVALIDAGADRLKKLEAAAGEADKRYGAAAAKLSAARTQGRREARQGGQRRTGAAEARAREIHRRRSNRDAAVAGPAGHRPRRVLGADQSRHAAGPADEGRLRRRAVALPAGAEGRAGRRGLGADAGVRRNRHRRRRRRRRRHRRAAGAARRHGAGDGGDPCAAGRRPRRASIC